MYSGDIRLGETIDIKFTTRSFTTGAPTTLAGTPVISAYIGNNTTELTAGITLSVDFDGVAGLNNIRVVATSGNGYATATNVILVITTGTVGGVSVVGEVVGSFSIEARSALMPTTSGRTATVNSGGDIDANVTKLLGTAWLTPGTAGTPDVNVKLWNALTTVALPLVPTTAGRTLDVSATGEAGLDWANIGSPTTTVNLSGTTIATTQKVDIETIKTNPVVNGGTVTFPSNATLASTTNITAGTITTVTNLTNAPTAGDFTATMKTSLNAATPASVVGAVGSVTGNVGGNVVGSVGSVAAGGITAASFAANAIDATALATSAVTEIATGVLVAAVEGTITVAESLRLCNSANASKLSGAATATVKIRDVQDTKDRITASVDASGNRTAVTLDVS